MDDKLNTDKVSITRSGSFFEWLDNFWYHYKWHTVFAVFIVFVITVCTVQMCEKESYDAYVLYAGDHAISRESVNGDYPEYNKTKDTVELFVKDYDENGVVNVSFRDLYTPDDGALSGLDESYFRRAYEDRNTLTSTMMAGDYFLCFFSPSVFDSYCVIETEGDMGVFANLEPIIGEKEGVEYYGSNTRAILLSSTDAYGLPGLCDLPDDTLVCIRSLSISTHLDKRENEREYNRAIETLSAMLDYQS